jgi:RNA polymerase sigma-70 factor (ECF subfamily)
MNDRADGPGAFDREALIAYADGLYNLARRLTGGAPDAEELVQETYARALGGAHTFLGGNLKAWLFKILRNTFVDLGRRGRLRLVTDGADLDDVSAADPGGGDLEPEQLRRLVTEDIEAALAALSDDARAIVLLDLEGFTETELADVAGCAVGTVKSRLSRARALLRDKLKDYAR